MTWQPIETAPRDGARVLVRVASSVWIRAEIGLWHDDVWVRDNPPGSYGRRRSVWETILPQPTHWQPLPSTEVP